MVSDCVYDLLKSTVGRHKRADLVAINKEGGPSYLFEFKYQRNENSSLDTKEKVRAKLLTDAKEQIKFYQTDDKLKTIDQVAYVRFASVYREFKDVNTFMTELKKFLE